LSKDVSAFANSQGGNLILGISESKGIAKELIGLDIDVDKEIVRMEQLLRNSIEPPIMGLRIRSIPINKGKNVLMLRIPRSWNAPHRVVAQSTNRFYFRHSAGVYEPSVVELRALFNQSSTALDSAKRFREKRIFKICNGIEDRPLQNKGRLIIHIVPIASFSGMINLDLSKAFEKRDSFKPLGSSGFTAHFNLYGFINERGGEFNYGYTQIFRNGSLEATKANIVTRSKNDQIIDGNSLEKYIFDSLSYYIDGLKTIGVPLPLIIMFSLEGVKGAHYEVKYNLWDDSRPTLQDDIIYLPECILEEYGNELKYHNTVRHTFDALWNASGHPKALSFDEKGMWVGYK
jgi:hypothetical protein